MTAAKLSFRKMVPDDADAVARVEETCFPVPWSRESFWREASNENTSYILAIDEGTGEVVGYAGCWILGDEAQITRTWLSCRTFAVAARARSSWLRASRRP